MKTRYALLLAALVLLLTTLACGLPPCGGSECRTQGCGLCVNQ